VKPRIGSVDCGVNIGNEEGEVSIGTTSFPAPLNPRASKSGGYPLPLELPGPRAKAWLSATTCRLPLRCQGG
jgi:hypothetical protein